MLAVAKFTALCVLVQVAAILAAWGVLGDVAIFVATIAGCAALLGGVVWWMRKRQSSADAEPATSSSGPTIHAYGTYNADTVQMRRRGRF
jgi:hypothetical protein